MYFRAKQLHALLAPIKPFAESMPLKLRRREQNTLG